MISAHDKEGARYLNQGRLERRDCGEQNADHDQLATPTGPDRLPEHLEDVGGVVLIGELGRCEDEVGGHGEDFKQREDHEGSQDAPETGRPLGVLGLFIQVGGDVPAPVVESGE